VFNSLLGEQFEWPARYAELKRVMHPGPAALAAAWSRLQVALAAEVAEVVRLGSAVIPEVTFADLQAAGGCIPAHLLLEVKKRGVVHM
jgi:hypothetical protein